MHSDTYARVFTIKTVFWAVLCTAVNVSVISSGNRLDLIECQLALSLI